MGDIPVCWCLAALVSCHSSDTSEAIRSQRKMLSWHTALVVLSTIVLTIALGLWTHQAVAGVYHKARPFASPSRKEKQEEEHSVGSHSPLKGHILDDLMASYEASHHRDSVINGGIQRLSS